MEGDKSIFLVWVNKEQKSIGFRARPSKIKSQENRKSFCSARLVIEKFSKGWEINDDLFLFFASEIVSLKQASCSGKKERRSLYIHARQNLLENAVRILPSLDHISSMLKLEWHGQFQ